MDKVQQQDVMDYVVYLIGLISAYEEELKKALVKRLQDGIGPVVRVGEKEITGEGLARIMLILHYGNPRPEKRAMERPMDHQAEIKKIIAKKRAVLKRLGIPFKKAPDVIESWLRARS